jgi:uncharacterized membrane protein YheB (UPF0754 family)
MNYWLILIPVISGFIGWFTNWIAIKMLFHPREPIRVMGITIQGIFPKRQQQFAEKLGKLVSKELLSFEELTKKISSPDNLHHIMPLMEEKIDDFLRQKLSEVFPVISMFIGENTINQLKAVFLDELESMFPGLIKAYMNTLESTLDLEKIVTEKVKGFSTDKMEEILIQIMEKEFRFVEILGGIVGFLIGLLQIVITFFNA